MRTIAPQAHCGRSRPAPWPFTAIRSQCRTRRTAGHRSTSSTNLLSSVSSCRRFRGRGRRYSTLAPARIGWARSACQGGRSGYGPKALGRLFRSHRVHASRRLEQRAQRAIPVGRGLSGVERPDGGGAVVGGREAPGAVAVEPSVLHHTFGKQTVGCCAATRALGRARPSGGAAGPPRPVSGRAAYKAPRRTGAVSACVDPSAGRPRTGAASLVFLPPSTVLPDESRHEQE